MRRRSLSEIETQLGIGVALSKSSAAHWRLVPGSF